MQAIREALDISERAACRYIGANRRMVRYVSIVRDDVQLRERLRELAVERRRFGIRRLAIMLQRAGVVVGMTRLLRVYRAANLQVRKRVKRRVEFGRGEPAPQVESINTRWSLDFVHDTLRSGRRIRALAIVDDFSRESLAIEVDTSLSGSRVTRVLDAIATVRGYPETIVLDNGHGTNQFGDASVGSRSPRSSTSYCAWKANAKRFHRVLQRPVSGRVPQRKRVRDLSASA